MRSNALLTKRVKPADHHPYPKFNNNGSSSSLLPTSSTSLFTSSTFSPSRLLSSLREKNRVELVRLLLILLLTYYLFQYLYHFIQDRSLYTNFTIVAVFRSLTPYAYDHTRIEYAFQYISLISYSLIVPGSHIIVFTDNVASCKSLYSIASSVRGLQCLPIPCFHKELQSPLLNCLINDAIKHAPTEHILFINGDIVLNKDIADTITYIQSSRSSSSKPFVIVGDRSDVPASSMMLEEYQSSNFLPQLFTHAKTSSTLKNEKLGFDLVLFSKTFMSSLHVPNFIYGVSYWDIWLLSTFIFDDEHVDVIDITTAVTILEPQNNNKKSTSHAINRNARAHNEQLITSLSPYKYKVGSVINVNTIVVGSCPHCSLTRNTNLTDLLLFSKRVSPSGYLVVLTVNSGYIPLAMNWVCWAQRIKFTHYILLSEDKTAARLFISLGVPVIVRGSAPEVKPPADYGSVAFQETMSFRTEFLMSVLFSGFHFVTADMDSIWLDDPIQYFDHNSDLQGQMHKQTKISGGLVIVRSTTYGKYFWNKVIQCQRENIAFLASHQPSEYQASQYTEQYCINQLSLSLHEQPTFVRSLLDPLLFPDGKSFFDEHQSQIRGIFPAIIHNNWLKGAQNKMKRLYEWKLISANDDDNTCIAMDELPPPQLNDKNTFTLKIRVLTYNRPESLQRLLTSLQNTNYDNDNKIIIDISVDHPIPSPDDADIQLWKQTKEIAHNFVFSHGSVNVIEQSVNIGLVGQWLKGWDPENDNEICIFFEDDTELSPHWYIWLKKAIHHYYLDTQSYDARMYGISLERQHLILGETSTLRFGARTPSDVLHKQHTFYKYQLVGTWGAAFFPQHWRAFQSWLQLHNVDMILGTSSSSTACVPTLLSNKWWHENPHKIWSQWFIRFSYEQGWYSLYSNFHDATALIVNYREAGINSHEKKGINNLLTKTLSKQALLFPTSSSLPVYDFHFNLIQNPSNLQWRRNLAPDTIYTIDQCWTIDMLAEKLAADQRIIDEEIAYKTKLKEEKLKKEKEEAEKAAKAKKLAEKQAHDEKEAKTKAEQDAPNKLKPSSSGSDAASNTVEVDSDDILLKQHLARLLAMPKEKDGEAIFLFYQSDTFKRLESLLAPIQLLRLIKPRATYLTVLDGERYGYVGSWLQQYVDAGSVLATDVNDGSLLLAQGQKKVDKVASVSPFKMPYVVDFVVAVESVMMTSKPYEMISEMMRVATKGIVLIEPHDTYINNDAENGGLYTSKILDAFSSAVFPPSSKSDPIPNRIDLRKLVDMAKTQHGFLALTLYSDEIHTTYSSAQSKPYKPMGVIILKQFPDAMMIQTIEEGRRFLSVPKEFTSP